MGLLGAAITGAGSLIAGGLGYYGQHSANRANREMAREQMQFQREMSNTQYQRTMEDMRLAGLNPILAAKLGGAGNLAGASSVSQNELGGAAASAMEFRRMKSELDNLKEMNNKIKAEVKYTDTLNRATDADIFNKQATTLSTVSANNAMAAKALQDTNESASRTRNIDLDSALKKLDFDFYNTGLGVASRYAEKLGPIGNVAKSFSRALTKGNYIRVK